MLTDLSVLKLSSTMTRHAAAAHAVVADNISRIDIPGATGKAVPRFSDALADLNRGETVDIRDTRTAISLDQEMISMASNAGRHQAAVTIWSKTLELVRLAGGAPR
ncbi:hypothetical protein [Parvularcula sp. LCG005]|uniref:hypothetical protein n=1 Tax=Parvularcula sp. LCG005 TaxID=3078805 RepID=UPI0029423FDD|nr:hypothetical protein [Parvularcula sp. LCG005]WOI52946.1 hypothetical protein RUI03_12390 [Parvularcula sp. LCG005]